MAWISSSSLRGPAAHAVKQAVASGRPAGADGAQALYAAADAAMYRAKRACRDRTCTDGDPAATEPARSEELIS